LRLLRYRDFPAVLAGWLVDAGASGTWLEAAAGAGAGDKLGGCPPLTVLALPLSHARQQLQARPATIVARASAVAFVFPIFMCEPPLSEAVPHANRAR
jgi:hypothetical protein